MSPAVRSRGTRAVVMIPVQVHPHVYVSALRPRPYADSGMSLIPIARVRPNGLTAGGRATQLTQGTPSAGVGFSSSAARGAAPRGEGAPAPPAPGLPAPAVGIEGWEAGPRETPTGPPLSPFFPPIVR